MALKWIALASNACVTHDGDHVGGGHVTVVTVVLCSKSRWGESGLSISKY